jgi:outer membrane protein TolC
MLLTSITNMRYYQFLLVFLVSWMGLLQPGYSQSRKSFDPLKDNIMDKLPPLATLIDSAVAYNPEVKFSTLQVQVDRGNLTTAKSSWTENLGLQGNYTYGNFNYLYNNAQGSGVAPNYAAQQSLSQYALGAYINLPFFDFINRHNQVKIAKTQVSQSQTLVQTRKMAVREKVITQYNAVVLQQRLLVIKSRYVETARINLQMAEKGFMNGTLSVDDYSRVSEISASTESDYETTKMDFMTAYMLLEETTGMRFNIYNEIPLQR